MGRSVGLTYLPLICKWSLITLPTLPGYCESKWDMKVYKSHFQIVSVKQVSPYTQIHKFQLYKCLQVAGLISTWLQASAGAGGSNLIVLIRLLLHIHTGVALVQHITSSKEMGQKQIQKKNFSAPRLLKHFTWSFFLFFSNFLNLGLWYYSLKKHFFTWPFNSHRKDGLPLPKFALFAVCQFQLHPCFWSLMVSQTHWASVIYTVLPLKSTNHRSETWKSSNSCQELSVALLLV